MSEIWDLALSTTSTFTGPASAFRKTRPALALPDLTAIFAPETPYISARRFSQFLEAIAHPALPSFDADLAEKLPKDTSLQFLGQRMPLLLALDLPQTHSASAELLCQWLDQNQGRSLDKSELALLSRSMRDHFEALGKRHQTQDSSQHLCACTTAFLLATKDLPQNDRTVIFEAVSDTPSWRSLQTTYWRVMNRVDKHKVNLAINGGPQLPHKDNQAVDGPVFLPEIPRWPKEKTSPRPGKSL